MLNNSLKEPLNEAMFYSLFQYLFYVWSEIIYYLSIHNNAPIQTHSLIHHEISKITRRVAINLGTYHLLNT